MMQSGFWLMMKSRETISSCVYGRREYMPGRSTTEQFFTPFTLAGLLLDCDAGEIADVLVRAGQGIEERGLAAVLVSDKRKDHV